MAHFIVGALATAALWLLATYARKNELRLGWWQWGLTVSGLAYAVFVVEVVIGFLAEGEPRAALVMGVFTGLVAVVWSVLLGRFVFNREAR